MQLQRHPGSPASPVNAITALASHLPDGKLSLVFNVTGAIAELRIPPPAEPLRQDGLWRHSCFEAFVRVPGQESYYEFNLSPSGSWAAYRFDAHRTGMADADIPPPIIKSAADLTQFGLVAGLRLDDLPDLDAHAAWQVGLSAVIEANDGSVSYWALAHPDGQPDFHHDACFAATLPPIGA